MLLSSASADYISDATLRLCFGRAVFCCPFPGELGSTTAHLRRLPRKGRAGGAYKTLLKHRVQGAALPAMLPSSPSADYISDATLRLCFGRAVFCCPFPGELGSTTAHLRRLPRKGRAGGAYKTLLKHRVQGAALPAMLPSSPSADYISDATLRLCFGRAVFCFKEESAAKRCVPPFFARQTVLYYNCIGACRKGSKPVRFTQGSVSRARCTEKAVF